MSKVRWLLEVDTLDSIALVVKNLATVASNATSNFDLKKEMFKRGKTLLKTPTKKGINNGLKGNHGLT